MFIGHYGPAAALAGGRIPLWHAAVAVQFLDILWALLVLLGIEHARIVPGFTAANAFDLYDMPWTHSLPMALLWSAAAAAVYGAARRAAGVAGAAVIGALVFSHWALDWLTHRPDLLLWFGGPKAGLGLWNDRMLSFALEIALYAGGFALYLARTFPRGAIGRLLPLLVMALALAAQTVEVIRGPATLRYGGGAIPTTNVVKASDFLLLHGNGVKDPNRIAEMVEITRRDPAYRPMPILFNEDDHFDFEQPVNNMLKAVGAYASWGYFDPGKSDYQDGYQCPPVNWGINTERKKAFFDLLRRVTGGV